MAELRVGTSGWHYRHWREVFYPSGLKTGDWLVYYSGSFDTVEINNSFYRLPSHANFESWAEQAPSGFIFAVKASRFITHVKKLKEPNEPISRLIENAEGLGAKLGPVLFQLPPRWKKNASRLEEFLEALPAQHRYVFEFRDDSWLDYDIYRMLEEANCALCIASSPSFPQSLRVTADFAFLRFHGGEDLYASKYPHDELKNWSTFASSLLEEGRDVYAYFNNDAFGYAVEDAKTFQELVTEVRG
jgi:uncharacterized protein YecE (DUF72 family)